MCGIIGYVAPNTPESRKLLANLIAESSYRGKHSTGIASFNGQSIDVHQVPLIGLEESLMYMTMGVPDLRIIAHTRYCTSDPETPLPLLQGDCAIVLNGVISQEPKDTWPRYDWDPYATGNDAEIMLRLALQGTVEKTPGSYAACFLDFNGFVIGCRSPERPMWWHSFNWEGTQDVAYVFTSTLDIALRADSSKSKRLSRALISGVGVCLNDGDQVASWETRPDLQQPHIPVKPCKL